MVKQTECDKLPRNNIVINNINMELAMTKTTTYIKKEIKHSEMKVVFEFPEPTVDDNKIKQEVKDILKNILQEQLKEIS